MKKIIYIIPLLFSLLLITSCSDQEGTIFDQGDSQNALFLTTRYSFEVETSEITVKLFRGNTSNAADIALTLEKPKDTENINFQLKSAAHFDAGQNSADVVISYNLSELSPTDAYSLKLIIGEEQGPLFSTNSSTTISIRKKLTFTVFDTGVFESEAFGESWDQIIEVAQEDPSLFRLPDLYEKGKNILFSVSGNKVTVVPQAAWLYSSSVGDIFIKGEGTIEDNVCTLMIEHYTPSDNDSFGVFEEILISDAFTSR